MIEGTDNTVDYPFAAAAPITPDELTATTGIALPDDPAALWQILDTVATKLGQTALAPSAEHDVAAMVDISERARRRMDGLSASLYLECSDRSIHRLAGYLTMNTYLGIGHRLGPGEARRRATTPVVIRWPFPNHSTYPLHD